MKFYLITQNQYDSDFIANFGTLPYKEEEEPLFLNPDGVRKRFPIGWNGHGRYIPGTLKVFKGDSQIDPDNIKQEYGGIFFEFATAPEKGSHTDYKVKYLVLDPSNTSVIKVGYKSVAASIVRTVVD